MEQAEQTEHKPKYSVYKVLGLHPNGRHMEEEAVDKPYFVLVASDKYAARALQYYINLRVQRGLSQEEYAHLLEHLDEFDAYAREHGTKEPN